MFGFIFRYLWNGIVGWIGIGGLIVLGCLAWAWFMPIWRKTALWCAVTVAVVIGAYAKGYHDEYVHLKAKWQQAEQAARKAGESARADALRDASGGMRDPFDSDDN